jgi:hypothetical protein
MTKFKSEDLNGHVIVLMEAELLKALAEAAEEPSGENRPDSVDHPRAHARRGRPDDRRAHNPIRGQGKFHQGVYSSGPSGYCA